MYPYPLTMEAKIEIEAPATSNLEVRAWELHLYPGAPDNPETGEYQMFDVPAQVGRGYFAVVWDGCVTLGLRRDGAEPLPIQSGLGLFSLEEIATIGIGANATGARVAVIGVLESTATPPDLRLPARGTCGNLVIPMPDIPNNGQRLTAILRQLQLTDAQQDPNPPNAELWPRPGYLLTTIDGPQAGDPCVDGSGADSPDGDGGLDFVLLATEENATYRVGRDPDNTLAYIIDFYAGGDEVQSRSPYPTEPGCHIRCWGP